ncbi:peptide chain release factor 2 [Nitzschia inconspicua]|uniref:Peptide chain release factor 2 n=2 Tax=Nitzschia inconspicua TaxID=303405 RepID=A0A9K3PXE8_9STRA|nr:peptide chain release factor 2 [Nitzschia inconspicua]
MLVFVSSKLLVSHFRVVSGFSVTKLQPIHLRPTSVCTSSLIRNTQFPFQSLHCHHRFNIHTGTRGTFRSNDYVGRTTTTATTTRCFATTDKDKNNQQHLEEGFLTDLKQQFQVAVDLYESNLKGIPTNLNNIVNDLETEVADPSFWDADNKVRNAYVTSQLSKYRRLQQRRNDWTSWKEDGDAALEMLQAANADDTLFSPEERLSLARELEECSHKLIQEGDRYQLELLLSGPYDDQPCRILLTAGAGGTEANDWVADLKRMYERHAQKMGYALQIEDEQPGDVVGYKSVELLVSPGVGGGGSHPYGWFRGEKGTHRLVRLSPFNANNKRQTTFAGVDVAPLLDDNDLNDIEIPEKDLEITAMRSGGAGGQNVNKVNSAVRIKHLPSGLNVKCTQERSQAMNKDLAMKRLKAQLLAIAKEQRVAEIKEIRGDQVEASWGTQIRNYILHPYKLIKDQRTGWETSNVQNFLDGDLEECIAELLKTQAKEQQELQRETEQ